MLRGLIGDWSRNQSVGFPTVKILLQGDGRRSIRGQRPSSHLDSLVLPFCQRYPLPSFLGGGPWQFRRNHLSRLGLKSSAAEPRQLLPRRAFQFSRLSRFLTSLKRDSVPPLIIQQLVRLRGGPSQFWSNRLSGLRPKLLTMWPCRPLLPGLASQTSRLSRLLALSTHIITRRLLGLRDTCTIIHRDKRPARPLTILKTPRKGMA